MSFNYEALKKSILTEQNRIRQDPQSYIPILRAYLKLFKGNVLYKPKEIPLETNEGKDAVEEAISFLKRQKPVDPLTFDERLAHACEEHVNDIGPKGLLSHDSTDGKSMSDRIELYVDWDESCGENIELGDKTGQDVILSLLIDDGIAERGHRANLFKKEFKYIGISCGAHRDYDVLSVLAYVGGIRDKGKPYFDYNNFKLDIPPHKDEGFKKQEIKKTKQKNPFQVNDEDAPDGTVAVKIVKKEKDYRGRKISVTKKVYTLADGTQQIIEVEEF